MNTSSDVRGFDTLKRILVVDDNTSSRELVRFALETRYVVEEATDGVEAINKISQTPPDLILMDIQMPEMDGYEALHKIRALPAANPVPVVAITAFAMLEDMQKAIEAGFDGYFPKPINVAALRAHVDSLLRV
ncbi:MAG TPA: response regulator [Terriglobia bacterium]|nr:response regulator [Terriglobia bacterium]